VTDSMNEEKSRERETKAREKEEREKAAREKRACKRVVPFLELAVRALPVAWEPGDLTPTGVAPLDCLQLQRYKETASASFEWACQQAVAHAVHDWNIRGEKAAEAAKQLASNRANRHFKKRATEAANRAGIAAAVVHNLEAGLGVVAPRPRISTAAPPTKEKLSAREKHTVNRATEMLACVSNSGRTQESLLATFDVKQPVHIMPLSVVWLFLSNLEARDADLFRAACSQLLEQHSVKVKRKQESFDSSTAKLKEAQNESESRNSRKIRRLTRVIAKQGALLERAKRSLADTRPVVQHFISKVPKFQPIARACVLHVREA
jgi:hypothetical protein